MLQLNFMKRPPIPRTGIYELYWQFAAERQAIFERRQAGQPAPWTNDPILAHYKFCNVFRATDRVSQFLINHVIYTDQSRTSDDQLFQIIAFRFLSRESTWNRLIILLGHAPLIEDLRTGALEQALATLAAQPEPIYTNAFILCATDAYGRGKKHLNHIALFEHMFLHDDLGMRLRQATSLQHVYDLLHSYPLIGDFMAYQIAIDLNYSSLINFSENDFTKAGPGALRGIAKCFETCGDFTPEEVIFWMVARQNEEFERLGLAFAGLYGRKLHAIDAQGLFCETDKYTRVARPDLKSARARIKQTFSPQSTPQQVMLPPKWHVGPRRPTCYNT